MGLQRFILGFRYAPRNLLGAGDWLINAYLG